MKSMVMAGLKWLRRRGDEDFQIRLGLVRRYLKGWNRSSKRGSGYAGSLITFFGSDLDPFS